MAASRLHQVGPDIELPADAGPPVQSPGDQAALSLILLSLKALSQRTLVALASLFTLALAISVFVLAYVILTQGPTVPQLVGLGIYCIFILALHKVK